VTGLTFSGWRRSAAAALFGALAGVAGRAAPPQSQAIGAQMVAAIQAQTQLTTIGPAHSDVVIVEYLDYNCPYCKKTAPELIRLLKRDPGVHVVIKEWPIFGEASVYAARSALAAGWQGKFAIAHDALMGATRDLDQNSDVDAVLRSVAGLDLAMLASDRRRHATEIDAALARTVRETHVLGVPGTPVFLVGRHLITSSMTLEQLQQAVAQVRTESRSAPR
jgi:protein-disulfide isomerase